MDPAEVRRKNLIAPDKFPYTTPTGAVYDTGDYVDRRWTRCWPRRATRELRAEQARRRERGDVVQLGIGLASYVEITAADAAAGETARLVVHGDGTATCYTGSSAHGQGHHTAWAMLVEAELGIPMAKVTVIHGDTDLIPEGVGTYASRSLQLGGVAVHKAAHGRQGAGPAGGGGHARGRRGRPGAGHRQRDLAGPRRPGHGPELGRRGHPRRAGRPGGRPSSTPRARPRSRSAPTSPWSRWTPRPARSG